VTDDDTSIRVIPGGPLVITGIALQRLVHDEAGSRLVEQPDMGTTYRLCRCGATTTSPICDHASPYACFEEAAPSGIRPKPFTWDLPDGSAPAVALKANGPVRVAGGIPVVDANGPIDPGVRVSLCRCGASGAQPLCDGTHKIVGFREP
jgi:CDGSH-type Zn-finger protein